MCASSCPVAQRTGGKKHSTSLGLHPLRGSPFTSSWPAPLFFPVFSVLAPTAYPSDAYCPEKEFVPILSPGHQCQVMWQQKTCTSVWSIGLLTAELAPSASKAPTGLVPTTAHSRGEVISWGPVPQEDLLNPFGQLCLPGC